MDQQPNGASQQGADAATSPATVTGQHDGLPGDGDRKAPDTTSPVHIYTQEELDKQVNAAHGTLRKQLHEAQKMVGLGAMAGQELEKARQQIAEMQERLDGIEDEGTRGDSQVYDVVKLRRELRAARAQFEQDRQTFNLEKMTLADKLKALDEMQLRETAAALAKEHGVDPALLADCGSEEQMRLVATKLAAAGRTATPKPDSGVGVGAGMNWHDLSPEEKLRRGIERTKTS